MIVPHVGLHVIRPLSLRIGREVTVIKRPPLVRLQAAPGVRVGADLRLGDGKMGRTKYEFEMQARDSRTDVIGLGWSFDVSRAI